MKEYKVTFTYIIALCVLLVVVVFFPPKTLPTKASEAINDHCYQINRFQDSIKKYGVVSNYVDSLEKAQTNDPW